MLIVGTIAVLSGLVAETTRLSGAGPEGLLFGLALVEPIALFGTAWGLWRGLSVAQILTVIILTCLQGLGLLWVLSLQLDQFGVHYWLMGCFALNIVLPLGLRRLGRSTRAGDSTRARCLWLVTVGFGSAATDLALIGYALGFGFFSQLIL
jgi:hypothetical protein